MSYQVIARKWRPQNFEDVVFQEHVSRTLQNSIKNKRISHAYLFSGPRGVGKTTMARILAMALDCTDGPTDHPCGVCENCIEIKKGISFDVIEIDGASNNGVEDIRELRENVNFAPVKGTYKVYIIDEVHMVTTQAFNALLKTLEEPPPHVVFIFATTEYHKIPETILSRCQKFFFKRIPVDAIVGHIRLIAEKESVSIADSALYPIARAADGAMRDAQSLLDQVISFSNTGASKKGEVSISEEDTLTILGIVPVDSYIVLLDGVSKKDAPGVIEEIDRIVSMGVDIPRYVAGLLDVFRTVRLIKNKVLTKNLLELSESETEKLKSASSELNDEELSRFFQITVELQQGLKFSNNERINLEMALLDMVAVKKMPSLSAIIEKLEGGGARLPSAGVPDGDRAKKKVAEEKVTEVKEEKKELPEDVDMDTLWRQFIAALASGKPFLHDILKPAHAKLKGHRLIIQYPPGDDHSYYHRVLDKEKRAFISNSFTRKLGVDIEIEIADASGEVSPAHADGTGKKDDTKEPVPGKENQVSSDTDSDKKSGAEAAAGEEATPAVEKIKNLFHGEIIDKGE